ncbi:MAG: hypothetical protein A3D67_00180 [Candidatus Lloydbacteria bacterium RIFCSPHIGHO2_02_FULL_51_22]|uniref:Uncharacterized protein n=2 Tax=Candidatus Lloydiibacteriota TaxID=1817910 RepID=A0A1G2DFJ2_9BACT|nr:MAG: hypothetical protein A3D67_00180 [Candidatus Lloydbacteria bacterium RIFCSPHIGHO2_02_FULL_51_22]OGZ15487.1 MAG: hypothetical protein A3J08_02315 [Candidatus Lloydbacteria bacterium RIFCSPLOWO2_02_FULL_51_11]
MTYRSHHFRKEREGRTQGELAKKSFFVLFFLVLFAPLPVFAVTITDIIVTLMGLLALVVQIVFGLAFLVFLWGIYKYIRAAEEGDKAEGRNTIMYGIIGLFVMVAVWGLVAVIKGTFLEGVDFGAPAQPKLPGQSP